MNKKLRLFLFLGLLTILIISVSSFIHEEAPDSLLSKTVELGNYGFNHYDLKIRNLQNKPELKWDVITKNDGLVYRRPNTIVVFQDGINNQKSFDITDFPTIRRRFDIASRNKDKYDYGVFLLMEEVFHPGMRVAWGQSNISDWKIEGSDTFAGVKVKLIKTWYMDKYRTWNQTWWDHIVATDDYRDPIVWAWSAEYQYNLHKAWHLHMKNLGKKSAIIGLVGIREDNFSTAFEEIYYPSPIWEYIIANYDLVFTYRYPRTISEISKSEDDVEQLRHKYNYSGKIAHILTNSFMDWKWNWNETIAFEEFKRVYPYVDVIVVFSYADTRDMNDPKIPYPQKLIDFSGRIK